MAGKMGVWIDHRKAVIVTFENGKEQIQEMDSDVEKHVRDSGGAGSGGASHGAQDVMAGDKRDRKYQNHLNTFYDRVVQALLHAEGIVILGPGEAKGELDKRITNKEMRQRVLLVETSDKLTNPQLVAKLSDCFHLSKQSV
ncbi:MAG: hypothetical protein SFV81_23470 [Pirellulaceae bacterium]|nr:hypothetical protein [Pirellulaceae bacterium]